MQNELISFDKNLRAIYATDASAYREVPHGVSFPKNDKDLIELIKNARENKLSLIPRTAGTSLAGQVVGDGIVVDLSRNFNSILEINVEESWVRVQPGVVRDELNRALKPKGLFFGPETSTANRAMIGGMVGNNSCGSNSVVYGSTRDHLLEVKGYLSDGSPVTFNALTNDEFFKKCEDNGTLEHQLYASINKMLSNEANKEEIIKEFPKPSIERRNTGYAIDFLVRNQPFSKEGEDFNFCRLIAGSEGTLMMITEIKLHVDKLPPQHRGLLCGHFESIDDSLKATLIALKYSPYAVELMDHFVLECTKNNLEQRKNRFFVKGDPKAILVIDLAGESEEDVVNTSNKLIEELKAANYGYHFPLVTGSDQSRVWELRKAGLGLLSNIPGDAKPVPVIEDTAVDVNDLPQYIADVAEITKSYGQECVHYAHAGSGEIHLRPILDLKTSEGQRMFRAIAEDVAALVKKYNGSLSGEHGDGRLRGEFIGRMIGEHNYQLLRDLKKTWDPQGVFNKGKITDTNPMDTSLRFLKDQKEEKIDTLLRFDEEQGYLRAAEFCNGSGDCRKSHLTGGGMCPSFMATGKEELTTRARANLIRERITREGAEKSFDGTDLIEVLDECLSCKACKNECPSNVDMAKLKAETYHQHYQRHGIPLRSRMIAQFTDIYQLASKIPSIANFFIGNKLTASIFKSIAGFAAGRSLPMVANQNFRKWIAKEGSKMQPSAPIGKVWLYADEFIEFLDVEIGIAAFKLLTRLNYQVELAPLAESGRTYMSKGLLNQARKLADKNIELYKEALKKDDRVILGLEPSTLLSFRDEYPSLVSEKHINDAKKLGEKSLMIDEFLAQEFDAGKIKPEQFTKEKREIHIHGHCHQKALSSVAFTRKILSIPSAFEARLIPSGCCGMSGSFGYEKEHFDLSIKIAELVLFPSIRKLEKNEIISAIGTSCRHQIHDGLKKSALHPVQILLNALK